jgi:hypothetical protein
MSVNTSRHRKHFRRRACLLFLPLFLGACRHDSGVSRAATPESHSQKPVPTSHDFAVAVRTAEAKLKSKSSPILLRSGDVIPGGVMLLSPDGLTALGGLHDQLEAFGAYLFIVEHGMPPVQFGPGPDGAVPAAREAEPDKLGLFPTTDKFEVVRMVGTNGNRLHSAAELLSWLRDLDRSHPFVLVGAGVDFVEGVFRSPVQDPEALARNVYSFCPDFWDQGIGLTKEGPAEAGVAKYFTSERYFYFWWD